MNKIAALGAVKADKHRGLVPSLPDGEEHGLSHVQVKTLCCVEVSVKFFRDFLDQLADKMSP